MTESAPTRSRSDSSIGTFGRPAEWLIEHYRTPLIIGVQLLVVAAAFIGSFLIRLDLDPSRVPWGTVGKILPLLFVARMGTLAVFRLYQGLWRYSGVPDLVQIVKASTAGTVVFIGLEVLFFGLDGFPRSVFLLDWGANIFLLSGIRLFVRLWRERFQTVRLQSRRVDSGGKRILIVGAGDAGVALCREALRNPAFGYHPVAFVDDDRTKVGEAIYGLPIVGGSRDLGWLAKEHHIDLAVIAVPSATPEARRLLVERCRQAGVDFKVLPGTPEILRGAVSIGQVRDVDPADLLGRPPARLDHEKIRRLVNGRRVLVTGAAGSVGSELCRQVAQLSPALLVAIDHAENALFHLDADLRRGFPGLALEAEIADVTDRRGIGRLMASHRPEIVLHAAAHKHVPLMERTPGRAVHNNVRGTYVLARAAIEWDVEKFVLVSTDKAVRPSSVMGATKRLAEMVIQELNGLGATRFTAVRFGNVLGSSGSVVPIFKQQIARGGPVTVTHPEATRYFMSIQEAASLILQACAVAEDGEIFVLDMGEPVRIVELARLMISLAWQGSEKDVQIAFTGLRPGEKLHEELYGAAESLRPTGYEKLNTVRNDTPPPDALERIEEFLEELPGLDVEETRARLVRLVPEYRSAPQHMETAERNGIVAGTLRERA